MMKKTYEKPEADKIAFNYRDQVVAASGCGGSDDGFMENAVGIGSPVCGSGGLVDRLFDCAGSSMCE